jgi:hypothetical protein
MVNVGFICEGDSDSVLFQSQTFYNFLHDLNIIRINVINAQGSGNLLPHNISGYLESLERQGSEKIVIVTDLDTEPCFTSRKEQIDARPEDTVIIAVKEIESWFLADSLSMRRLLRLQHFNFDLPEEELEAFDTINNLLVQHTGIGVGKSRSGKLKLAKRMLDFGYDFHRSAVHGNCSSAAYFVNKIREIGSEN